MNFLFAVVSHHRFTDGDGPWWFPIALMLGAVLLVATMLWLLTKLSDK
jgi:hypothetical protein